MTTLSVSISINDSDLSLLRKLYPGQTDEQIIQSCVNYTVNDGNANYSELSDLEINVSD
jgi:hypothetical protein